MLCVFAGSCENRSGQTSGKGLNRRKKRSKINVLVATEKKKEVR